MEFSIRFTALVFIGKFALWLLLVLGLIQLDRHVTHLFEEEIYRLMVVFSLVPPAANVAAFAAQFDLRPGKAAMVVLIGTIFALFYIPVVLITLGLY